MIKKINILFFFLFVTPLVFAQEYIPDNQLQQAISREEAYAIDSYIEKAQAKITANWHPAKIESPIITVAELRIGKKGELLSFNLIRPTGVQEQDEAAMRAVQKALPFESLPENYNGEYIEMHYAFDCEKIGIKDYPKELPKQKQIASNEPEVVRFTPEIEKIMLERMQEQNVQNVQKQSISQTQKQVEKIETTQQYVQTQKYGVTQENKQIYSNNQLLAKEEAKLQTQNIKKQSKKEIAKQLPDSSEELYQKEERARQYINNIRQKIMANWTPVKGVFNNQQDKNNITAEIQINKTGELEAVKIVNFAQDNKAESNVLKAIKASAPFASFPVGIDKERVILIINFGNYSAFPPMCRFE